jgi:hypothetical protein
MGRKKQTDWSARIAQHLDDVASIGRGRRNNMDSVSFYYEYSCSEDFHLRNGQFYEPFRQTAYRQREHGQCFQNAYAMLVENPKELRYCEGFASSGVSPVYHCWNLDAEGRVVDVTWAWGDPNEKGNPKGYFGVCFPTELVRGYIDTAPHYGMLDDPANKFPLLRARYDPDELLRWLARDKKTRLQNRKAYRSAWGY